MGHCRFIVLQGALQGVVALGMVPAAAYAQSETVLIEPSIPVGFDKGRNVSVTDRSRPDYDPLGLRVRDFVLSPQIGIATGITDNVYLSSVAPRTDGFVSLTPSIRAQSDWSRHQVQLRGGGDFRRFITQPRRNETSFYFGALGRLDYGSAYALTAEAQIAKQYETPFSGELQSDLSVLSSYYRSFFSVRGQYQAGQGRAILVADRTAFSFNSIPLGNNAFIDQSDRDRHVSRLTGQVEYALTPSASFYVQAAFGDTAYNRLLRTGGPNRDSRGYRLIGGMNLDLAGFLRGTIGLGYVRRDFKSSAFQQVSGISAEARVQYFYSELTTFSLAARRTIEDSSIASTSAFFDNRVTVRVDHELLRNLLLNATADYSRQNYIGTIANNSVYRVSTGARYLLNHEISFEGLASYGGQSVSQVNLGRKFDEFRAQAGIVIKR